MRFLVLLFCLAGMGYGQQIIGRGCTTATYIDKDCDGYGVRAPSGADADDNDATVNTTATALAKYGTVLAYLQAKGYNPTRLWYLSTTGNDTTCAANNESLPCGTWGGAQSKLASGDFLVLRGGTYSENRNYDIFGGSLVAYPGEKPILTHGSNGYYGLNGWPEVAVDGLTITTPGGGGIGISMSYPGLIENVAIRNCDIYNYYRNIWGIARLVNITVEDNVIHDDSGEHAVYFGQNDDSGGEATNVIVRNNLLYNSEWNNFHFNGICNGCRVEGNIMYSPNMAGGGAPAIQLQQGFKNGFVRNNIVMYSSGYAMLINNYDDGNSTIHPYDQTNNVIANNTFIHTGRDSAGGDLSTSCFTAIGVINNSSLSRNLGNNKYINNIFVEAAVGNSSCGAVVRYTRNNVSDGDWLSTDTWQNNVIWASNGASPLSIPPVGGSGWGIQNWTYFQTNAGTFTNNLNANPGLTAWDVAWYNTPTQYNLIPAAGSIALGTGLSSADVPTTDIRGLPRGSTVDIGAYQVTDAEPPAQNPIKHRFSGSAPRGAIIR